MTAQEQRTAWKPEFVSMAYAGGNAKLFFKAAAGRGRLPIS